MHSTFPNSVTASSSCEGVCRHVASRVRFGRLAAGTAGAAREDAEACAAAAAPAAASATRAAAARSTRRVARVFPATREHHRVATVSSSPPFEPPPATTQNSSPPAESTAAARGTGASASGSRRVGIGFSAPRTPPSRMASRKPTSIATRDGEASKVASPSSSRGVTAASPETSFTSSRSAFERLPEVKHASRTRRRPSSPSGADARSAASATTPRRARNAAANGGATSGGPPAKARGAHARQSHRRDDDALVFLRREDVFSSSSGCGSTSALPEALPPRASADVSPGAQRHAATPPSSCTARSASGVDDVFGTKRTRDTGDTPWKLTHGAFAHSSD